MGTLVTRRRQRPVDQLSTEIWCHILQYLGDWNETAEYRFVNRQWSSAVAMNLTKKCCPVLLAHSNDLYNFNSVMRLSNSTNLLSSFEIRPMGLLNSGATIEAVITFLNIAGSTVKSYAFEPFNKDMKYSYPTQRIQEHGQFLLMFLTWPPRLDTLKINFHDEFVLPVDAFEKLPQYEDLRHVSVTFPYQYCRRADEYLLLAAILDRAPRLTRLDLSFQLKARTNSNPRAKPVFAHALEMLKKLNTTITIQISATPDNYYPTSGLGVSSLLEFSMLHHRFSRIEIVSHIPEWDDLIWNWAIVQKYTLAYLSVRKFPPKDLPLFPFSKLKSLTVRSKTEQIQNMNLATAFQTLTILNLGVITDSSVMLLFVAKLVNLEELKLEVVGADSWFSFTGQKVQGYFDSSEALNTAFLESGGNNSDIENPFTSLTKLQTLTVRSDRDGIFGILYSSKRRSLKTLSQLILSHVPLPDDLFTTAYYITGRGKRQLESCHQNVQFVDKI